MSTSTPGAAGAQPTLAMQLDAAREARAQRARETFRGTAASRTRALAKLDGEIAQLRAALVAAGPGLHLIPDGGIGLPYARAWNDGRRSGVTCPVCAMDFSASGTKQPGYLYAVHFTTAAAQGR